MTTHKIIIIVIACLVINILTTLFLTFCFILPLTKTKLLPTQTVDNESQFIAHLVTKTSPAVVSILARERGIDQRSYIYPNDIEPSIGTGFIVDKTGLIITNEHVVSETDKEYFVTLKDGTNKKVIDVYREPTYDLAILKIEASNLPILVLGDSSKLQVGQRVLAIGNALGNLPNTVTQGIVSGLSRTVTARDFSMLNYRDYRNIIQTDAALNPGNSGGPLIDFQGEVIGINTAGTWSDNVGFAIPVNTLKKLLSSFKTKGKVVKPFLGIKYALSHVYLVQENKEYVGERILEIAPNSPAAKAGLAVGDTIIKINNTELNAQYNLDDAFLMLDPNSKVTLTYIGQGGSRSVKEISVTLSAR